MLKTCFHVFDFASALQIIVHKLLQFPIVAALCSLPLRFGTTEKPATTRTPLGKGHSQSGAASSSFSFCFSDFPIAPWPPAMLVAHRAWAVALCRLSLELGPKIVHAVSAGNERPLE